VTATANIPTEAGKKDTDLDSDNVEDEREAGNTLKTVPKKRYLGDIIEEADANNRFLLGK